MSVYGFPWPEMLSCDKYPEDNDMCLRPVEKQGLSSQNSGRSHLARCLSAAVVSGAPLSPPGPNPLRLSNK